MRFPNNWLKTPGVQAGWTRLRGCAHNKFLRKKRAKVIETGPKKVGAQGACKPADFAKPPPSEGSALVLRCQQPKKRKPEEPADKNDEEAQGEDEDDAAGQKKGIRYPCYKMAR